MQRSAFLVQFGASFPLSSLPGSLKSFLPCPLNSRSPRAPCEPRPGRAQGFGPSNPLPAGGPPAQDSGECASREPSRALGCSRPGRSAPSEPRAPSRLEHRPQAPRAAPVKRARPPQGHYVGAGKQGRKTVPKRAKGSSSRGWGGHRRAEDWSLTLKAEQLGEASAMLIHF